MWTILKTQIPWFQLTFGVTVRFEREPMAVLVLTGPMKRAHKLKNASESVF